MERKLVERLLRGVKRGETTVAAAIEQLSQLGTGDLGFARIDHHRSLRRGMPEVVLAEGKSRAQVTAIVDHVVARRDTVLVTRLDPQIGAVLAAAHPAGEHDPLGRTFLLLGAAAKRRRLERGLLVVSAGTSDLPVVGEAVVTARAFGLQADQLIDVGVAGVHRLLERTATLRQAECIIVVAGMEGALPSLVAGLVDCPVIGVPTSVGYGAALSGLTPLLGMLTSCAGGLTVVNIDNGFGAACAARSILSLRAKARRPTR